MALKNCKECGNQVSTQAKKCPHCGAPQGMSAGKLFLICLLGLPIFVAVVGSNSGSEPTQATPSPSPTPTAAPVTVAAMTEVKVEPVKTEPTKAEPTTNWSYRTDTDKMSGKEARYATIESENLVHFGFPYGGHNQPRLMLRKHPKYGTDAILSVDKGQFLCSSYDGCYVEVKFDDKPSVKYSASEPADHSSEYIFINSAPTLIKHLKKAKTVHIRATFYNEGDQIMTFKTAGLEWK